MSSSSSVSVSSLSASLSVLSPFGVEIFIDEDSACSGAKVEIYIGSDKFSGAALLARHRLVQEAIKSAGLMDQIHALTIKAWTKEEWEKKKDSIPNKK
jgi:stress-induced morphogen